MEWHSSYLPGHTLNNIMYTVWWKNLPKLWWAVLTKQVWVCFWNDYVWSSDSGSVVIRVAKAEVKKKCVFKFANCIYMNDRTLQILWTSFTDYFAKRPLHSSVWSTRRSRRLSRYTLLRTKETASAIDNEAPVNQRLIFEADCHFALLETDLKK